MSLMSSFKGVLGETVINIAMWLKLDKDVYHRLNNITLPLAAGGSTQIDHIIVCKYGIFVIETKNYKGWIFGNEHQRQWTQVIMGRKYKFQNPLRQNYLHIKTLSDLLALDMRYFHSMIAFIGECELKTRDELPEHVLTSGMVSYVKQKQDKMLTDEDVKAIVEQIESNRFSKSWKTNSQHKAYLADKHRNSKKQSSSRFGDKSVAKLDSRPTPEPSVNEPSKRPLLKSREVLRWSGQSQVEQADVIITSASNNQLNNDEVFITPFEVLDSQSQTQSQQCGLVESPSSDKPDAMPSCPKCQSEMIRRVAKKGARQGQHFFGCCQFPKCRGVVNID